MAFAIQGGRPHQSLRQTLLKLKLWLQKQSWCTSAVLQARSRALLTSRPDNLWDSHARKPHVPGNQAWVLEAVNFCASDRGSQGPPHSAPACSQACVWSKLAKFCVEAMAASQGPNYGCRPGRTCKKLQQPEIALPEPWWIAQCCRPACTQWCHRTHPPMPAKNPQRGWQCWRSPPCSAVSGGSGQPRVWVAAWACLKQERATACLCHTHKVQVHDPLGAHARNCSSCISLGKACVLGQPRGGERLILCTCFRCDVCCPCFPCLLGWS